MVNQFPSSLPHCHSIGLILLWQMSFVAISTSISANFFARVSGKSSHEKYVVIKRVSLRVLHYVLARITISFLVTHNAVQEID